MNRSLVVSRSTVPAIPWRTFRVPDDGSMFVRVVPDWKTSGDPWYSKPRAYNIPGWKPQLNPFGGFPAWFPLTSESGSRDHVKLTCPMQELWYTFMGLACGWKIPDLKDRWGAVIGHGKGGLNDFFSVDQGYWDCVRNINPGAEVIQQKYLAATGNLLKVIGVVPNGDYLIEAIDARSLPSVESLMRSPWLLHMCTQSTIIESSFGGWKVVDFAQLNYQGIGYGVPYLLFSEDGKMRIPRRYVEPIAPGSVFSPYYN